MREEQGRDVSRVMPNENFFFLGGHRDMISYCKLWLPVFRSILETDYGIIFLTASLIMEDIGSLCH